MGPGTDGPRTFPQEQPVHERSKKATSHRVRWVYFMCFQADFLTRDRLGPETASGYHETTKTRRLDTSPIATFIFKYRPIGKQLYIVNRHLI